uniref:ShKT domain-containing protein n=1 Tax=Angiostrongylus costaricensis TaxID=334426 RepID=A0A0R3PD96_ANGCS
LRNETFAVPRIWTSKNIVFFKIRRFDERRRLLLKILILTKSVQFVASATNCENKYSTSACVTLFGVAVVEQGAVDRDAKCSRDAAGANQELKQLAISTCPKHCGYCCETPEYKCDNKLLPRVKCETVTPAQCTDPTWRAVLAEDCPKTCGLCLSGLKYDKKHLQNAENKSEIAVGF